MSDVARRAGVSQKTVSRVVNDEPNVSDGVRERVHQAIRELGFRPNPAARALVTRLNGALGILTPATALFGPSAHLLGMEKHARSAGYSVVIASVEPGRPEQVPAALEKLLLSGVDGVLIGTGIVTPDFPVDKVDRVPAVVVGDPIPGDVPIPSVVTEQAAGAGDAVAHLVSLGHTNVSHVAGPTSWKSALDRQEAWRAGLEAAGLAVPAVEIGDWTAHSGYVAGQRLVRDPSVTAIFAANDHMAIGVMRAAAEAGRRIPDDLSIVGFDDVPEAAYLPTPLTTVRQDFDAIAHMAVGQLLRVMGGEEVPAQISSRPELVVRTSSGLVSTHVQ
jgi:DNA-binding LacI/PurR family transcriptional regulator